VDDSDDLSGVVRVRYHHPCKASKGEGTLAGPLGSIDLPGILGAT
jgi:hypothetical protein